MIDSMTQFATIKSAFDCLMGVTLILGVTWFAVLILRSRAAALRHRALTFGLLACLCIPIGQFVARPYAPRFGTFLSIARPPASVTVFDSSNTTMDTKKLGDFEAKQPKALANVDSSNASFSVWGGWLFAIVWIFGSLFHLSKLAYDWRMLSRVRIQAVEVNDPGTLSLVSELMRDLKIDRRVSIRCSDAIRVPMTMGAFAPTLLLPAGYGKWNRDRVQVAVKHELTHIARHDVASQTVADIASALYWFHPLVRMADRLLRLERELACDDSIVYSGCARKEYALHLVEIAADISKPLPTAAIAMATRKNLESRVVHLMHIEADRRPVGQRSSIAVLAVTLFLLGATVTCLPTFADESADKVSIVEKGNGADLDTPAEAIVLLMHPAEMRMGNTIQRLAAANAVSQLRPRDYCGILQYNRTGTTWLWNKPELAQIGDEREERIEKIFKSNTGDFPEFETAFTMAFDALVKIEGANRRMLILTDGDPAPPSKETLAKFKEASIPVSVVHADIHGLGPNGMAKKLTTATGGRYYYVMDGDSKSVGRLFQMEAMHQASDEETENAEQTLKAGSRTLENLAAETSSTE